jgi:hypothetical protein
MPIFLIHSLGRLPLYRNDSTAVWLHFREQWIQAEFLWRQPRRNLEDAPFNPHSANTDRHMVWLYYVLTTWPRLVYMR